MLDCESFEGERLEVRTVIDILYQEQLSAEEFRHAGIENGEDSDCSSFVEEGEAVAEENSGVVEKVEKVDNGEVRDKGDVALMVVNVEDDKGNVVGDDKIDGNVGVDSVGSVMVVIVVAKAEVV